MVRSRRKALGTSAFLVLALYFSVDAIASTPAATEVVQVRHALDGDSLLLVDGRQVRLIGVNTPEIHPSADKHARVAPQPLAREAQQFTATRVNGQHITLRFEQERTDRHRRLLAHVTLADGTNLEESLLRAGLGWMVAIPPNVNDVGRLQAAEDEAQAASRGVWGQGEYAPVTAARLTTKNTGFLLASGTIYRVSQSSYAYYFDIAPRVSLLIPRTEWNRYFARWHEHPQALIGRVITARGWASAHEGRLRLRVPHPAMLTFGTP